MKSIFSDQILDFLNAITEGTKQQTRCIRYAHLSAFFNFITANIDPDFHNPCSTPILRKMFKAKPIPEWDIIEKAGDALTHGEKKGGIRVVLGDGEQSIIAERTFTDKSSTISLTKYDAAGKPIETISAADFKNMLSKLSVNPHKIMGMGPTERVRTLMAAADIDIDLEALDAKIKQREEERLTAFRRMESIEPGEEPEKAQAVSTQELLQERNQILFHNDRNDKVRRECDDLTVEARSIHISLGACNEEIIAMEEALRIKKREWVELTAKEKELQGKISTSQSVIKGLEDKSTVAIDEKLSTIDETNKKAAAHSHWVAETKRYEEAKEAHLEIFRDAKYLQDKKAKALGIFDGQL